MTTELPVERNDAHHFTGVSGGNSGLQRLQSPSGGQEGALV